MAPLSHMLRDLIVYVSIQIASSRKLIFTKKSDAVCQLIFVKRDASSWSIQFSLGRHWSDNADDWSSDFFLNMSSLEVAIWMDTYRITSLNICASGSVLKWTMTIIKINHLSLQRSLQRLQQLQDRKFSSCKLFFRFLLLRCSDSSCLWRRRTLLFSFLTSSLCFLSRRCSWWPTGDHGGWGLTLDGSTS